jgi:transcriptional regulator with XRE-family HTH domain
MANGSGSKRKHRGFITYKSYLFKDKDPIIDCIRTARSDKKWSYLEVSERSGVGVSTIVNWENGDTKSPMFKTAMAVINALGLKLGTKDGKPYLYK